MGNNYKNLEYTELLLAQKKVSEFLKIIESEYENVKKLEEDRS